MKPCSYYFKGFTLFSTDSWRYKAHISQKTLLCCIYSNALKLTKLFIYKPRLNLTHCIITFLIGIFLLFFPVFILPLIRIYQKNGFLSTSHVNIIKNILNEEKIFKIVPYLKGSIVSWIIISHWKDFLRVIDSTV